MLSDFPGYQRLSKQFHVDENEQELNETIFKIH